MLTHGCALCAMRTHVNRRIENRFLTNPDTVFNYGIDRTTHGTVAANGTFNFHLATVTPGSRTGGLGFFLHQAELAHGKAHSNPDTGTLQEFSSIHGRQSARQAVMKTG